MPSLPAHLLLTFSLVASAAVSLASAAPLEQQSGSATLALSDARVDSPDPVQPLVKTQDKNSTSSSAQRHSKRDDPVIGFSISGQSRTYGRNGVFRENLVEMHLDGEPMKFSIGTSEDYIWALSNDQMGKEDETRERVNGYVFTDISSSTLKYHPWNIDLTHGLSRDPALVSGNKIASKKLRIANEEVKVPVKLTNHMPPYDKLGWKHGGIGLKPGSQFLKAVKERMKINTLSIDLEKNDRFTVCFGSYYKTHKHSRHNPERWFPVDLKKGFLDLELLGTSSGRKARSFDHSLPTSFARFDPEIVPIRTSYSAAQNYYRTLLTAGFNLERGGWSFPCHEAYRLVDFHMIFKPMEKSFNRPITIPAKDANLGPIGNDGYWCYGGVQSNTYMDNPSETPEKGRRSHKKKYSLNRALSPGMGEKDLIIGAIIFRSWTLMVTMPDDTRTPNDESGWQIGFRKKQEATKEDKDAPGEEVSEPEVDAEHHAKTHSEKEVYDPDAEDEMSSYVRFYEPGAENAYTNQPNNIATEEEMNAYTNQPNNIAAEEEMNADDRKDQAYDQQKDTASAHLPENSIETPSMRYGHSYYGSLGSRLPGGHRVNPAPPYRIDKGSRIPPRLGFDGFDRRYGHNYHRSLDSSMLSNDKMDQDDFEFNAGGLGIPGNQAGDPSMSYTHRPQDSYGSHDSSVWSKYGTDQLSNYDMDIGNGGLSEYLSTPNLDTPNFATPNFDTPNLDTHDINTPEYHQVSHPHLYVWHEGLPRINIAEPPTIDANQNSGHLSMAENDMYSGFIPPEDLPEINVANPYNFDVIHT